MRQKSVIPGVILIIIGVAYLGELMRWWQLSWPAIAQLWPLLLIMWGIRLLLPQSARADWIMAALLVVGSAAVISTPTSTLNQLTGQTKYENRTSTVSQGNAIGVDSLKLNLSASSSTVTIDSSSAENSLLYSAISHGANLSQTYRNTNGQATATIAMDGNWLHSTGDVMMELARRPSLDLSIDAGASTLSLDATNLNLHTLTVDGGASSSRITLGNRVDKSTVSIDGGAMDLVLRVPQAAGLKITDDSGLSSSNIGDLGLSKNGSTYTSADFDNAKQQISIHFDGGAAHLTLQRY